MTSILLALVALLAAPAVAHPSHDDDPYRYEPPPKPDPVTPETLTAVVAELETQANAADKALEGKRIADLFKACDAMTTLIAALPEKAKAVSDRKAKAAAKSVPTLDALVATLKSQASKGSFEAARAAVVSLRAELKTLDADGATPPVER